MCVNIPQCKVYLVEDVLMSFLLGILEGGGSVDEHPLIQQLLDLFWLLMEVKRLEFTKSLISFETGIYPGLELICIKTSRCKFLCVFIVLAGL